MYVVLPSRIEPGYGYISVYRPDQYPTPNQALPNPTQTGLGVFQASPAGLHVPLGRAPLVGHSVLLGQGFRPVRPIFYLIWGVGMRGRLLVIKEDSQESLSPTRTQIRGRP